MEKEIQSLLLKGQSVEGVAIQLLKRKSVSENTNSFLSVCRFMYRAGLYNMIISVALSRLAKKELVPWAVLIETLVSHKINITDKLKNVYLEGIKEQNQIKEVLTVQSWNKHHPEFKQWKLDTIDKINQANNKDYLKLLADLEFIQTQGVLQKEKEILERLRQTDPDNPDIQNKWRQFEEKLGRHIIHKKKLGLLKKIPPIISSLSPQAKNSAENIFQSAQKLVKDKPEYSYDLALLFSFMDHPLLAIRILQSHLDSVSAQWLYADLLLQSNLYVNCLSLMDSMELQYKSDPDVIFALTYIRAKAYYGLGRKSKAKNILSELLKIRPDYRLIPVLLEQWEQQEKGMETE